MKIATYNVNGINARLPVLKQWLTTYTPDVVCLQELKSPQEKIPVQALEEIGYKGIWHGQKSWNGVAILSRNYKIEQIRNFLPGELPDEQSRYIEAVVNDVIVACLYLPNGNPVPGPKYDYKLEWLVRLQKHAKGLLSLNKPALLTGDFNIIPTENDVYKPERWVNDALFLPEVREVFHNLTASGWTDAIRKLFPKDTIYTFWDYYRNAYQRNAGMRIDHFLLSPHLKDKIINAGVNHDVRGWEKSSDHAPVWIELDIIS